MFPGIDPIEAPMSPTTIEIELIASIGHIKRGKVPTPLNTPGMEVPTPR
jgi:hypothetical protein